MTRVKSVKAETGVYTCRDYSKPNTVHVFINLQRYVILGFHTFKKKKKLHTSASFGVMIVILFCLTSIHSMTFLCL